MSVRKNPKLIKALNSAVNQPMAKMGVALRAPGARYAVECAAATQLATGTNTMENQMYGSNSAGIADSFTGAAKARLLDRWLDRVVEFSGSQFIFFAIITALLVWAFLGIPFGKSNDWQVGISDAQAIINMVFDAFLMRQQLNSHHSIMFVTACLRSRIISNKRMLKSLVVDAKYRKITREQFDTTPQMEFTPSLPQENWLGRISTVVANAVGHIATVCAFWVGIFVWIGFGSYCGWSDTWQLYINSATSALMVFILAFLANIRERHSKYMTDCLGYIYQADCALEEKLRNLSGDRISNAVVTIPAPKRRKLQRAIDYYADLVGTLLGIGILFLVIIVWVVIGPAMSFNSNWWLLIGTYAGLIGLNDGFVLRNVQNVLAGYENSEFINLAFEDMDMLAVICSPQAEEELIADNSLSCRASIAVGDICSHEITVALGVLTIIGLVIGASAMHWSVTGQLICNVPPSIIESFFMMILITGHNIGDAKRRVDLHNIYSRRLRLISYANACLRVETCAKETTSL